MSTPLTEADLADIRVRQDADDIDRLLAEVQRLLRENARLDRVAQAAHKNFVNTHNALNLVVEEAQQLAAAKGVTEVLAERRKLREQNEKIRARLTRSRDRSAALHAALARAESERDCLALALQFALTGDGWTSPAELRRGVQDILATGPFSSTEPTEAAGKDVPSPGPGLRDQGKSPSGRAALAQVTTPGEGNGPMTESLAVRWEGTVTSSAGEDDETLVSCLDQQGRLVALKLDDEHREALGLLLLLPEGDGEVDPQHLELARENHRLAEEVKQLRGRLAERTGFLAGVSYERERLLAQVRAAATVPCSVDEAGRQIVFARDLAEALGIPADRPLACPACGHHICKGAGPCGAIITLSAVADTDRCPCPGTAEPAA